MRAYFPAIVLATTTLAACSHAPGAGDQSLHNHGGAPDTDARTEVVFPEPLRSHTLSNMRDHLKALAEIQVALAEGKFDTASAVAEQRLGKSPPPALRVTRAFDCADISMRCREPAALH